VDAERLAWAVAFNVGGGPGSEADTAPALRRSLEGYRDRWPLDTPWAVIWSALIKPLTPANPSTFTLLGELAWSVACEQRDAWQPPGARPISSADADRAFAFVYASNKRKVTGDVSSKFGDRAGQPDAIADEAWSRVFSDYWSIKARKRFLGLARISTLVCQVARYVAIDALRERRALAPGIETPGDGQCHWSPPSLDTLGIAIDPASHAMAEEIQSRIRECMGMLPAKQRIVAEMVWLRDVRAKRVAESLLVSESAVSQLLKKARDHMRECLGRRGLTVPGQA
jgi:RNA polymerase sigma factor (sigma-70 family)